MSLFHGKDVGLAYLVGTVTQSGANASNVIGGAMTVGSWDANGSAAITFTPPFVQTAPIVQVSIQKGIGGGGAAMTASNYLIQLTGITSSGFSIASVAGSGTVIGITAIGLQKL
jgi:hypothetical protein